MTRETVSDEMILQMRNILKNFGPLTVLDGVSLDVKKGEVVAIIGPSGSGKTTLLRCINGLENIQGGEILVEGIRLDPVHRNVHKVREKIGFIFPGPTGLWSR